MTRSDGFDPPKDGDFAAWLERKARLTADSLSMPPTGPASPDLTEAVVEPPVGATLKGVLIHGEAPTPEFVEEFAALEGAPDLDEEELARQALADPGADGDRATPE